MLGDNPLNIFIGETYSDAGATALDNIDDDLTDRIVVTGTVNSLVPGTYTITYYVMDNGGNEAIETRTITVIDNVKPTIAIDPIGNSIYAKNREVTIHVTDMGIIDNSSLKYVWTTSEVEPSLDEFTSSFTNNQPITTPSDVSGSYYLWVVARDTAGNETISRSDVFSLDNTKPIITLNGNANVTVSKGSTYTDAGATASDEHSGIDGSVTVTGSVNVNVVGTYTITYTVSDKAGNEAIPVTRTINVVDVKAPVITILGDNPVTIYANQTYSDAGATALDDVDGDVTSSIQTTGTVNPSVVGTYTITYTVRDKAGNEAVATRTVIVSDSTPPTVVFGMNGNSTYAKSRSTTVTVSDSESGVNTSSLKYQWTTSTTTPSEASFSTTLTNGSTINTPVGVSGSYYLWILAKDNATNTSITRSNAFNLDNVSPILTITGSSSVTIDLGTTYIDAGATATDNIHGTMTSSISTSSTVNTNTTGTYTVTYTVSDTAGNTATTTRQVVVQGVTQYRSRTSYTSCSTCYDSCPYSCNTSATKTYYCSAVELYLCNVNKCCWDTPYENAGEVYGSASISYSCPSGYTLSGSTCLKTCYQSCNPYSCSCSTSWNSWSSWGLTPVSPSSTREVQTRTCTSWPCPTS
jgi:P2-related tail formation protein